MKAVEPNLPTYCWEEKRRIRAFPKVINAKWNANSLVRIWKLLIVVNCKDDNRFAKYTLFKVNKYS